MKQEAEIGDIQFFNTVIADLKEQAKAEKRLKERIVLAKVLNHTRGWLKYAESKILVVLLLAILLLCSGCGKMLEGAGCFAEGIGQGFVAVGQHAQEAVKE